MSNPVIDKYGNKRWFNQGGELHRENGPACEYTNGGKEYYINGLYHRVDGPAVHNARDTITMWYQNGKLHREDGPAIQYSDGYKEYWINGIEYDSLEEGLMDQALK